MRKLFFLLFLTISHFGFAQLDDTTNVYFKALKLHIKESRSTFKTNQNLTTPDVYYVQENIHITPGLPELIEGVKIEYISDVRLRELTRENYIWIIEISPAMWNDGKLVIYVTNWKVYRKRNDLYFTGGGVSSFNIINFTFLKN